MPPQARSSDSAAVGRPLPGISKFGAALILFGLLLDLLDYATEQPWTSGWLWTGEHSSHLLVFIGMVLTLVGVIAYGVLDVTPAVRSSTGTQRLLLPTGPVGFVVWSSILAAGLSIAAGAIHLAVVGEHVAEYPTFGVLFAVLASFQGAWAFAYTARPNTPLAVVALAVNGSAIVVWAVSRTAGLPIGAEPWIPEAVGALDVLASAIETAIVGVLGIAVLPSLRQMRRGLSVSSAVALVGSVLIIVAVLTMSAFRADTGHADHSEGTVDAADRTARAGQLHASLQKTPRVVAA